MSVNWLDRDTWGNPATCVHIADNGSHVPDQLHEDDGGAS